MVNERGVIAPVIEFSSLDSVRVCSSFKQRPVSYPNNCVALWKLPSARAHVVWNNIGCCKIRHSLSHIYPMSDGPLRDDQWPEERSPFVTKRKRERERGKKSSSGRVQQISLDIFPTLTFLRTILVPRKPQSRRGRDKSRWLIKATERYREIRLFAAARKCHISSVCG